MRKLFILLIVLSFCRTGFSQDAQLQTIRNRIDSIISLVKKEKNESKKVDLLLSIYTVSVDGYPVLLLETYQKLYPYGLEMKDLIVESSAWSLAGQGYRLTGNYVKALECHYKAIALAEKTGNSLLLAYAQNQMAHIYKDRQENQKALELYRQAAGNDDSVAVRSHWWAFMNMGAVYLNMGELDSSLYYSLKSESWFPVHSSEASYTYILSNIGSVYSRQGKNEEARKYLANALAVSESFQSPRYINVACMTLAEHFYLTKQYDSSLYYAKKAVNAVEGSILSNLALKPAKLVATIYQTINADSSLKYWRVYMAANDSVYSTRTNQQLMMMAYDEERKKAEFENEQKAYRSKIKTNLMLGTIGAAVLIVLILYRNNRQRKKTNNELQKTLTDLKSAQTQLIQAEKMASLGELTAGIAHEIQNPLNFVNNFSEVNNELLVEMNEEIAKENYEEVKAIAKDITDNEKKINHHGKRADAIVKGMLQHSQSSAGVKEPTDINKLTDEYLRLSYHGLRAKDKSFNATLKTDFDESIGKINVVPQDIGRVIMNLLTNAFFAVEEKRKQAEEQKLVILRNEEERQQMTEKQGTGQYQPTIFLSTKKTGNKIEISIADNGNGIPQDIAGKIFQPFFTTKPTGQGTGLGLSLSYDIIKAHGGELSVETKESEYAKFTITLPV